MILSGGSHTVDQTTPWERRFGGWYVTGKHGDKQHLGNLVIKGRRVDFPVENAGGMNVTDLRTASTGRRTCRRTATSWRSWC